MVPSDDAGRLLRMRSELAGGRGQACRRVAPELVNRSDNEALCVLDACWAQFRAAAATDTVAFKVSTTSK